MKDYLRADEFSLISDNDSSFIIFERKKSTIKLYQENNKFYFNYNLKVILLETMSIFTKYFQFIIINKIMNGF